MATICFTYRVFLLPFWKLFTIQCHLHKKSCSAHIITEANLLSKHIKHQIVIYLTDGGWSNWTSLACSVTCGIGVQASFRKCNNPAPEFGGNPCDGDTHLFQYCNTPCAGKNYSVVVHVLCSVCRRRCCRCCCYYYYCCCCFRCCCRRRRRRCRRRCGCCCSV